MVTLESFWQKNGEKQKCNSLKFLLVLTFFAAESVLNRAAAVLLVRLRWCEEIRAKPNVVRRTLKLDDCERLGRLSSFAYAVLIS